MPESWLSAAFCQRDREYCVADRYRRHVSILMQDIREQMPDGPFDLILCRNLAFTYFVPELQRAILCRIRHHLRPSGYLVLGAHEALPAYDHGFQQIAACREIYHYGPSNKKG
jgi:chemotaxis protein methyltransferase CheR